MRRVVVGFTALAVALSGTATARASVTVTSFSATPSTTTAGAHPNLTQSFNFSYSAASDDVKSTVVRLPAGLVGNPNGPGKCNVSQLNADSCPAASKIGTVSSSARQDALPLLPPVTSTGDVYNVTPTGNEPARVGMVIRPLGGVLGRSPCPGPAAVRVPGDFGLNVTFENIPRTLPVLGGGLPVGIQIQSLSLTLNGVAPGGDESFPDQPDELCSRDNDRVGDVVRRFDAVDSYVDLHSDRLRRRALPPDPGVWSEPGHGEPAGARVAGVTQPSTEFPRSEATIRTAT